jgi:hypothetical protein
MAMWLASLGRRHDPWWDVDGVAARKRRKLRLIQASLAVLDLWAVTLVAVAGPPTMRLFFLQ